MILHVMAGGHEFIGEATTDNGHTIRLKDAVKLYFINDGRGIRVQLKNLRDNNDYDGTVVITNGPGVTVLNLVELGSLAKQYMQAKSNIQIAPANTKIKMN